VARLTRVWIWPDTGKPHKPWDEEPELDSFLRTSRRVAEAFRTELEREQIDVRDRRIELYLDAELGEATIRVRVDEYGVTEGTESGSVTLSRGFHTLDPYTRAFYVADVLHAATRRLGEIHDWDLEAIDRAMDRVRAADYSAEWTSGWRPSASGEIAARLHAEFADDGFARVSIQIADAGHAEPRITSVAVPIGTRRRDLVRLFRRVGWDGDFAVSTRLRKRVLTLDALTGELGDSAPIAPRPNDEPIDRDLPLPHLVVEAAPPIAFTIGGGPMNKVPEPYSDELDRLFGILATELEWVAWWMQAGIPLIELEYDFEPKTYSTTVSISGDILNATIARPRKSIPADLDGVDLARADVATLLDEVRLRTGLVAHPRLPV
jgi:hypothetical protein